MQPICVRRLRRHSPSVARPIAVTPVSYGSTLNQLVNSTAPDKGVGLQLTIPLRNRVAQATQIRSELEYRQAQMRLQQLENQVRIEIRNAQFAVQQNRASVSSAQAAVDLGRQSLDAEQKKYALGASTTTLVLQNRSALAQAESTLVSAMAAYEKAQVELDRATGLLLDHSGILLADAERGEVTHMPSVPFVSARAGRAGVGDAAASLHRSSVFCVGRTLLSDPRLFVPLRAFRPCGLTVYPLRVKLSVVLITCNEETNLARTLESVRPLVRDGQGEIIVVDSGSTDRTVEIAKSYGARVFVETWKGYAAQKNSAIEKATGDWILSLDADEELDGQLQGAIATALENLERVDTLRRKADAHPFMMRDAQAELAGMHRRKRRADSRRGLDPAQE